MKMRRARRRVAGERPDGAHLPRTGDLPSRRRSGAAILFPLSFGRPTIGLQHVRRWPPNNSMEHALAKLGLFASVLIVGFLARRPKLPIVLLGTILPTIALVDRILDGRLSLWVWVAGFITASLAFAAIVVAVFLTRAGFEGGDFGAIPSGR